MNNPIYNENQFAAERDVIAMWQDSRVQAARQLVGRMWKTGWADTPPDEVVPLIEGHIDEYVTNWLFKAAASDTQHPRFVCNFMMRHEWHGLKVPGARTGGDNPDNIYRLAGIEHGAKYRVRGRIIDNMPANTSFTLVGNYGTSVTLHTIESHEIEIAKDGSFEIAIDDENIENAPNHLKTAPNVKFLFVRDSLDRWDIETPLELSIERLDPPKEEKISLDEMAERAIRNMREDVPLYYWFQSVWTNINPSTYLPPEMHRNLGGLVTQALAKGHIRIDDGHAAIIEYTPAGARYVSIQLSDWLYRSHDAGRIQSSLTQGQSHIDEDGRIRAVISARDPGVANWLDTGGFEHILILHRWQALQGGEEWPEPEGSMKIVPFDQLRPELPASTRWVTPDERAAQINMRRKSWGRRFGV